MTFQKWQWWLLLQLCLLPWVAAADGGALPVEPREDYPDSVYAWQAEVRFLAIPGEERPGEGLNARNLRLWKRVLDDRQQTQENLYLAASAYAIRVSSFNGGEDVPRVCASYPPRADDYRYKAVCLWYEAPGNDATVQKIKLTAEAAWRAFPHKATASRIYDDLAELLTYEGRSHEAIMLYKLALEYIPKNDEETLMSAKEGLAFVYANPLMSERLRRLAIEYYSDVIAWHEAKPESQERNTTVSFIAYNRGIARIFLFHEYADAIQDFTMGMKNEYLSEDATVFLALSYARMGLVKESLEIRNRVALDRVLDPERRAFLQCYVDLTDYALKRSNSVESCLSIEEPQIDVLAHLTEVLQDLSLTPSDENRMWRRFYRFFKKHFLPDMQRSIEVVSSQAELEREQANNRLNQLKIQNLSLYQNYTRALVGLAAFLIVLAFMGFRLWYSSRTHGKIVALERQRLQNILDNIDEGIIAILSDLSMKPEMSPHLQAIVGPACLDRQPIDSLLGLTELQADQRSTIRACLRSAFGEDRLAWELNCANLPTEVMIAGKPIALFWAPVYHNEVNIAVFLVLHDVSSIRQLEKEREQAIRSADRMLDRTRQILAHPRTAASVIEQLPQVLDGISSELRALPMNKALAFQQIHSLKGTSRTLGLKDLQEACHHLEDKLQSDDAPVCLEAFAQLKVVARHYQEAMEGLAGKWNSSGPESIFEMVVVLRAGVTEQLRGAGLELAELRVVETMPPSPSDLPIIQDILLHGLSNAADHGFVRPRHRGQTVAPAILEVAFRCDGSRKILTIRDNGVGIDHEAIQKIARKTAWSPGADQVWTDILFESGVSTAENVSQSSGRGVGLSAIRDGAKRLGGRVQLIDNDQGPGTLLQVEWSELAQKAA